MAVVNSSLATYNIDTHIYKAEWPGCIFLLGIEAKKTGVSLQPRSALINKGWTAPAFLFILSSLDDNLYRLFSNDNQRLFRIVGNIESGEDNSMVSK